MNTGTLGVEGCDRRSPLLPALLHPTGLWCHGVPCLMSTCDVAELLDSDTTKSAGTAAYCDWKDENTVVVTFGGGGFVFSLSARTTNTAIRSLEERAS